MQRWVLFGSITCCWLLTVGSAHGQKFKLPSLLPFKSQEKSVKPFQLTDQAEAQFRLLPEKPMFGLFDSSEKREKKENGFLTSINEHSRQFWNNAGKSLSGLTAGTRDVLESTRKRLESPGWRTFNHQW